MAASSVAGAANQESRLSLPGTGALLDLRVVALGRTLTVQIGLLACGVCASPRISAPLRSLTIARMSAMFA